MTKMIMMMMMLTMMVMKVQQHPPVAKYRFPNERRSHATSQDVGDAVAAVAGGALVSGPSGQCLPRKCKAVTVYSHSQNSEAFIVQVKMDTIDTEVMQIHLMDDT